MDRNDIEEMAQNLIPLAEESDRERVSAKNCQDKMV